MKKVALFVTLLLLGTAALGAPAKPAAPPPKPIPAANPVAPAAQSSQGFTGISLNFVTVPSFRLGMGSWSLDLGLSISSPASGRTDYTVLLRSEIPISEVTTDLRTYFAPGVTLANVANNTTTTLFLLLGAEYKFAPHLAIFADLTALSLSSSGGTTTWFVGANNPLIYTGGRLYF